MPPAEQEPLTGGILPVLSFVLMESHS